MDTAVIPSGARFPATLWYKPVQMGVWRKDRDGADDDGCVFLVQMDTTATPRGLGLGI